MTYLDYSATTPVDSEVIDTYSKVCSEFIGNPNSLHKLGVEAKKLIDASTEQIKNILELKDMEVIYTSGSSEANNTAVKGICLKYSNRGKHIITTELEHSSIVAPLNYLSNLGYEVDFVKLNDKGVVDLEDLKSKMRDDTILVTISSVNSEVGVRQPIEEISKIVKEYPKCFFHSDVTQSIGKEKINLNCLDLASFSGQKFFGMKGIGCLLKKESIVIEPLIHGGKSTTIYRSGTPQLPLIVSTSKALRLALENFDEKLNKVKELNNYLKEELIKYENVRINSNGYSIPQILNISVLGVKPETLQHSLEEYDIYISTQTACSKGGEKSRAVYALTNDEERAKSSVRISISYVTTKEELDEFLKCFKICYEKLTELR